jgi:hypothetical protein
MFNLAIKYCSEFIFFKENNLATFGEKTWFIEKDMYFGNLKMSRIILYRPDNSKRPKKPENIIKVF